MGNLRKKKQVKQLIKKVRTLATTKQRTDAQSLLSETYKALDKAAKTGLIKKKAASRRKARITRLLAPNKEKS